MLQIKFDIKKNIEVLGKNNGDINVIVVVRI